MFVRIVKLSFREDKIEDFERLFEKNKIAIRNQPGCKGLRLLHDKTNPCIFFTYSDWEKEEDLENYRQSELFSQVWGTVKPWFTNKAEAWSVDVQHSL
ncbi:MAG TPA: antibiotic biosynthesis monooxygenase [Flavobacteriales bacterium]|nr:antibiotic biosynthesis monooxygenase [Flavobacteriales bacterium]HRE97953.1 antibiotic biosynthesis monooxygenase [Flavobacteriales bacterium]HRJ36878.1 antibiotic biosynthesis monooxygenase [Flavobacteriales bacterium]HRJ37791.1 antibiotic biosynthesis monooxygenase [Flavobacteriales bacterium]